MPPQSNPVLPSHVLPSHVLPSHVLLGDTISHLKSRRFEECLANWLHTIVAYDNIIMLSYYQDRPPSLLFSLVHEAHVLEKFETTYIQGAYLLDPFHTIHTEHWAEGMYRLEDIAPDQFRRNRYFREYYKNTNMVDEMAYIAYPVEDVSIHVTLSRDMASSRRFSAKHVSGANLVAPIVCALVKRHWSNLNSIGTFEQSKTFKNLIEKVKQEHQISLSPRQAQVAELILKGHSSVSIGLQLGVSSQTVKVFRKQLYKKCQISSQAELFNFLMPVLSI